MEIHFTHHAVTLWHPAMLTAVALPGIIAWITVPPVTRVALTIRAPWSLVCCFLAVILLVVMVTFLTAIVFEIIWRRTEGPNVYAGFGYVNRFVLLAPMAIVLVLETTELRRASKRKSVSTQGFGVVTVRASRLTVGHRLQSYVDGGPPALRKQTMTTMPFCRVV
jgi:hypothetical protein